MTYREAIRFGLRDALLADNRVFLMGEDVGRYGGAYACSHGLLAEFGEERIRDTPLSESGFVGAGIGAALGGMCPIVEVMTVNFSLLASTKSSITRQRCGICPAGRFRFRLSCVWLQASDGLAPQHSHSLENWYAHIPGIKVLTPATVTDARWMLGEALKESDPVFIFEHALLYPLENELEGESSAFEITNAKIHRSGHDVSLITYGGSLHKCLQAAEELAKEGIEAEVVDLRVLRPIDSETILISVAKTHRAVIVDEGWRTGSFAGEVSAQIMEGAFDELDFPVQRVCSEEVPIPYAKHLEDAALPSAERIIKAVRDMFG